MGVQLIIFGQGDAQYVEYFNWAMQNWPGQLGFSSNYNEPMAQQDLRRCGHVPHALAL